MSREEVWAVCANYVDNHSAGRVAKARGSCTVKIIADVGLYVELDGVPHPAHADIVGWPEQKDRRKLLQQKIAQNMTLDRRSN